MSIHSAVLGGVMLLVSSLSPGKQRSAHVTSHKLLTGSSLYFLNVPQ